MFKNLSFALDWELTATIREKDHLKQLVQDRGGDVTYAVTKQTSCLVIAGKDHCPDSYKLHQAQTFSVPVVTFSYILNSMQYGRLEDIKKYLIKKYQVETNDAGETNETEESEVKVERDSVNVDVADFWGAGDDQEKAADSEDSYESEALYEVLKFCVLRIELLKRNWLEKPWVTCSVQTFSLLLGRDTVALMNGIDRLSNNPLHFDMIDEMLGLMFLVQCVCFYARQKMNKQGPQLFQVLELHVTQDSSGFQSAKFCVHSSEEIHSDTSWNEKRTVIKYRHFPTLTEAVNGYTWLCKKLTSSPSFDVEQTKVPTCGTAVLKERLSPKLSTLEDVDIVEDMWKESWLYVKNHMATGLENLTLEKVVKAVGILEILKEELQTESDREKIEFLSTSFYKTLPHSSARQVTVDKLALLAHKQDLCQFVRGLLSLSESFSESLDPWDLGLSVRWRLCPLKPHAQRFRQVEAAVYSRAHVKEIKGIHVVQHTFPGKDDVPKEVVYTFYPVNPHLILGVLCSDLSKQALLSGLCLGKEGMPKSEERLPNESWEISTVRKSQFVFVHEGSTEDMEQSAVYLVELALHGGCDGFEAMQRLLEDVDEVGSLSTISASADQGLLHRNYLRTVGDYSMTDVKQRRRNSSTIYIPGNFKRRQWRVGLSKGVDNSNYLPVCSIAVEAKVMDMIAQVSIVQTFVNDSNETIQGQYHFPMDESCAVTGFEAVINDKHIYGKIEEVKAAHHMYNESIEEGHRAYLLEQGTTDQELFTMKVGNLKPHDSVLVTVTYVCELPLLGDCISFRLPRLQPDDHDTSSNIQTSDCSVEVSMEMPFDITTLKCETHSVKIERTATKATVKMDKNQQLTKRFQLLIGFSEIHLPRMWVERHPDHPWHQACMVAYYPEHPAAEDESTEMIFLVDVSKSMAKKPLKDAKSLIHTALRELTCKFNIVTFGHELCELFPSCVSPTQENCDAAQRFVTNLKSSGLCTDLKAPISTLNRLSSGSTRTAIFLITDGWVNGQAFAMEEARQSADQMRIFTLAVGSRANSHFLSTLAMEGGGFCEMFDSKERHVWERKMSELLEKASNPCVTNLTMTWQQFETDLPLPEQSPAFLHNLYCGSRCVVYGFVQNCTVAYLNGRVNGEEVSTVVSTPELCVTEGTILHSLTAHALIRDWQHGVLHADHALHEMLKFSRTERIVQLSKAFNVLCPLTSFVAVEENSSGDVANDKTEEQSPNLDASLQSHSELQRSLEQQVHLYDHKLEDFQKHMTNLTSSAPRGSDRPLNNQSQGKKPLHDLMNNKAPDPIKQSLFGGSAYTSQFPKGLFGTTSSSNFFSEGGYLNKGLQASQGLLGKLSSQSIQPSQSLFGTKTAQPNTIQPSHGLFGSKTAQLNTIQPSHSLFGSRTAQPKIIQPSQSLFGSKPAQQNTTQPPQGLFGNKTVQPNTIQPSQGLFGNKTVQPNTIQPSQGLFGNKTVQPNTIQPSQGLFGNKTAQPNTTQPSQGLFGNKTVQPNTIQPSQGLFGNKTVQPNTLQPSQGLFGNKTVQPNTIQPSQGLFVSKTVQPNTIQPSLGLIGSKPVQPNTIQPSHSLFGCKAVQPNTIQPSYSLFGSKAVQPNTIQPSYSLFDSKAVQSNFCQSSEILLSKEPASTSCIASTSVPSVGGCPSPRTMTSKLDVVPVTVSGFGGASVGTVSETSSVDSASSTTTTSSYGSTPTTISSADVDKTADSCPDKPINFEKRSCTAVSVSSTSAKPFSFGSSASTVDSFSSSADKSFGFGSAVCTTVSSSSATDKSFGFGSPPAQAIGFGNAPAQTFSSGCAPAQTVGFGSAPAQTVGFGSAPAQAIGFGNAPAQTFSSVRAPAQTGGLGNAPAPVFSFSSAPAPVFSFSSAPAPVFSFGSRGLSPSQGSGGNTAHQKNVLQRKVRRSFTSVSHGSQTRPILQPSKLKLPSEISSDYRQECTNTWRFNTPPAWGKTLKSSRSVTITKTAGVSDCAEEIGEQEKNRELENLVQEQWDYVKLVEYLRHFESMLSNVSLSTGFHGVKHDLTSLADRIEQTKRLLQAKHNLDMEGHQLQSLREFVHHKWSVKETSHLLTVLDDMGDLLDLSGRTAWPPGNCGHVKMLNHERFFVRCGRPTLSQDNLEKLFSLQKEFGQWEFSEELDELIAVDKDLCVSLLNEAGIKSLGKTVGEKVFCVLATLMVLLVLLDLLTSTTFPVTRPQFLEELSLAAILRKLSAALKGYPNSQKYTDSILRARTFVTNVDKDHILVYSQLELGSSWEEAAAQMLGLIM